MSLSYVHIHTVADLLALGHDIDMLEALLVVLATAK
jgi:hypothetical protein